MIKYGGDQIKHETQALIKEKIQIPTGFNLVSGAGNLNSKYLIHAVGPNMHDIAQSGLNKEKLLAYTARNCFIQAAHLNCNSLALPAISCGDFGFPIHLCAKIMFEAIQKFQMGYEEDRNAQCKYPN